MKELLPHAGADLGRRSLANSRYLEARLVLERQFIFRAEPPVEPSALAGSLDDSVSNNLFGEEYGNAYCTVLRGHFWVVVAAERLIRNGRPRECVSLSGLSSHGKLGTLSMALGL